MSLIKDYPIQINNADIPWGDTPVTESRETLENVSVTEAGTDVCQVERLGKLTLSFNYQLPKSYRDTFYGYYSGGTTLTVKIHNGTSYDSYTMRMRNWNCQLVSGAEQTSGVYKFSFDLIEM